MKVETDMPTFQRLTKCLAEIYPQATVELLASDPALRDLGFAHEIPCTIETHATQEQINEIKEMAIQFEIDAINSADGTYLSLIHILARNTFFKKFLTETDCH